MKATLRHIYLCRTANMSWRTCVIVKQIQSNQPTIQMMFDNWTDVNESVVIIVPCMPSEDTQPSTRNARLRSQETWPHWGSEQMYDLQARSPSLIQWVSWSTRIAWRSLHQWLQNGWESVGSSGHQPPFPGWWDNLPPPVQKIARQQHHLCS